MTAVAGRDGSGVVSAALVTPWVAVTRVVGAEVEEEEGEEEGEKEQEEAALGAGAMTRSGACGSEAKKRRQREKAGMTVIPLQRGRIKIGLTEV